MALICAARAPDHDPMLSAAAAARYATGTYAKGTEKPREMME
jgi:hypothetical protein